MKKQVIVFGLLMAGAAFISSCTKNLKDDIKDLRNQLNEVESILGSNEPIDVTTTFEDDNGSTRTVSAVYRFKAGNYSTQYMLDNGDGTYEVYIERFSDVEWYEGAWLTFDYNPVTKAITNIDGGHYWSDADPYYDNARYLGSRSPAPTVNLTINSINMTTGDISLSYSATGSAAYTTSAPSYYSPNQGKSMSTNFTFTGKLKVFSTK